MSEETRVKRGQAAKLEDIPGEEAMELTPEQAAHVKAGIGPIDSVKPFGPIDSVQGNFGPIDGKNPG